MKTTGTMGGAGCNSTPGAHCNTVTTYLSLIYSHFLTVVRGGGECIDHYFD